MFVFDAQPGYTFPAGWTELFKRGAADVKIAVHYRIADGTEGATINVTTGTAQMSAHTSFRITGYSGVPEAATEGVNTSANPNSPSLVPSWGAQDTLWIALCCYNVNETVTVYPTNYTGDRNDYANDAEGVGIGTAQRELNAASENPDAFTISGAQKWIANTIAIMPVLHYGYRLEVHKSDGDLISMLRNPFSIRYTRALNEPHQLAIQMPADDDALDDITVGNEIWLRDLKDGTVVRKFQPLRRHDRRG